MNLPESKLIKKQEIEKVFTALDYEGRKVDLFVTVRHDDSCGNGHNTFSLTGGMYESGKPTIDRYCLAMGAIGDTIAELVPGLAKYNKWHLTSTDGPLHYTANTIYHAKEIEKYQHYVYLEEKELKIDKLLGLFDDNELQKVKQRFKGFNLRVESKLTYDSKKSDIEAARKSAIWPDATLEQLLDEKQLTNRLPELMQEFKRDIEKLGLTY